MMSNCRFGDEQSLGDLSVLQSFADEGYHLSFSIGENGVHECECQFKLVKMMQSHIMLRCDPRNYHANHFDREV